ncbi:MAG: inositol monophosphatase family protein [bacterium]
MELEQHKQVISQAVMEAGDILFEKFKTFDRSKVQLKSLHEIVTEYDLLSEKIILSAIKENFSDHAVLSEEKGANKKESDWLWAVDPIDGTTNFSMHNPIWAISVGLFFKKEIVLGVIYAPVLKEFYIAIKDKGVFLNDKPIKVSEISQGKVLNAFCHGYDEENIEKIISYFSQQKLHGFDCRQLGSAAIELAFVSAGRLESLVIPGANTWDVAAGILMVREAGGKVTDFDNNEWQLKSKDMVASNALVHDQILQAIKTSQNG